MRGINRYIALFVILLLAAHLSAQEEYLHYEYSALGVKLGGTYTTIALQPAISDLSGDMSYSGGLVYVFSNKKYVGVQVEALFTSRKWKEGFDQYQATTELQYLEIPLMTNINLGAGKMKYIINLGTYFAFKLDKTLKTNLPWDHEQYEGLMSRSENGSDFGLLIGGAIRYISSVGIFQFDARYAYGYQKLYNEDNTGFRYSNMSTITVGVIYMINISKNAK